MAKLTLQFDLRLRSCVILLESGRRLYVTLETLLELIDSKLTKKQVLETYAKAKVSAELFFDTPSGPAPGNEPLTTIQVFKLAIDLAKLNMSQNAIGEVLGLSQSYVSKLLAINLLPVEIITHWTEGISPAGFDVPSTQLPVHVLHNLVGLRRSKRQLIEQYADLVNLYTVEKP